jgi:hypothetical protein
MHEERVLPSPATHHLRYTVVQYNLAIRILGGGARVFLQHAYSYTDFAKTGKLKAGTHILGVSRGGFGGESSRNPPYTVHLYGKTLIRCKNLAGGGPGIFLLTDMPRSSYKTRGRSGIMLTTAIFLHGIILISRLYCIERGGYIIFDPSDRPRAAKEAYCTS